MDKCVQPYRVRCAYFWGLLLTDSVTAARHTAYRGSGMALLYESLPHSHPSSLIRSRW